MDGTFRFGCTTCGRCCTTPPALTPAEALDEGAAFAWAWRLSPLPLLDPDTDPQAMDTLCTAAFGASTPEAARAAGRWRLAQGRANGTVHKGVLLVLELADMDRGGACPRLGTDGLCTVHATRPSACRLVPFAFDQGPDANALLAGPRWRAMADAGRWPCAMGPDAPTVARDGRILDTDALRAWGDRAARTDVPNPDDPSQALGPAALLARAAFHTAARARGEDLDACARAYLRAAGEGRSVWFPGPLLAQAALSLGWRGWARVAARQGLQVCTESAGRGRPTVFGGPDTALAIVAQWKSFLETLDALPSPNPPTPPARQDGHP